MPRVDAPEPGRNDPCPCGSGRKYKECCRAKRTDEESLRRRLRKVEGRLVPEIFGAAAERWNDFLEEAWEEFWLWKDVPEDPEATPEFLALFVPWTVFSFVPDPDRPGARRGSPVRPAALMYLEEHEADLTDLERRFLAAGCRSAFSFQVVLNATPGRDMLLRDVLTGRERRVLEVSASRMASPNAILYAMPMTLDEASILLGCAPIVIPPSEHNRIIDFRQALSRRGRVRDDALAEYDSEIRALYFGIAHALLNPAPPKLVNTDGDAIVPTTLEFELRCPVQSAFDRLKTLSLHDEDELLDGAERGPGGALRTVEIEWMKRGNRQHRDWDNTILGHLEITEGRLTANVNSRQRADRLRREIAKRLGREVVFAGSKVEDVERLLEEPGRAGRRTSAEPPPEEQSPEARAALEELMARHWEAWVDQKVPALGNRTPRQAARTPLGRERLEALLAEYAWRSERQPPGMRPDLAALRRKLGI